MGFSFLRDILNFRATALVVLGSLVLLVSEAARAEPLPCLGFDAGRNSFDAVGLRPDVSEEYCSDGYAFVAALPVRNPKPYQPGATLRGNCCPLPPETLGHQHSYTDTTCPPQMVVTGYQVKEEAAKKHVQIRCTDVNRKVYRLGTVTQGVRVGQSKTYLNDLLPEVGPSSEVQIPRAALPAGIRFAVGRMGIARWSETACVGSPPGSLVVGVEGMSCSDVSFAPLLSADVHSETPERIFPDCQAVTDIYSPTAVCAW